MPEPTNEMTSAIYDMFNQALLTLQEETKFTTGDVMSAAILLVVDAGMVHVVGGAYSRKELIKDIADAAKDAVMSWEDSDDKVTLQ